MVRSTRRLTAALAGTALALSLAACGGDDGEQRRAPKPEGIDRLLPPGGDVPARQVDDLGEAAEGAGCRLESSKVDSREHTASLDERVRYRTDPPTSGRHFQEAAPDGAYGEPPADTGVVHAFEHGRVGFWFRPDLSARRRAQLRALAEEDTTQLLLLPRPEMQAEVAASAWNRDPEPLGTGRLLTCDQLTDRTFDALRAFRDEHRGQGPEPIP